MPGDYPCPNPTCSHVFASAVVAGAGVLTCPRCGGSFPFRAAAPARPPVEPMRPGPFAPTARPAPLAPGLPPPALPVSRGVAPPAGLPQALPSALPAGAYQPPTAQPVPNLEQFEDLDRPSDGPVYRRSTGTVALYVKTLIFAGLLAGVTLGVVYLYQNDLLSTWLPALGGSTSLAVRPFQSDAFGYRFAAPAPAWLPDDATQTAARTNICLSRSEPTAWAAVIARDFKSHTPGREELVRLCLGQLHGYMADIKFEEKEEAVELGGLPAFRLLFEANVQGVGVIFGEAYLLGNRTIGYAVVTWAPQPVFAQASKEFNDVRKGFALLHR